MSSTAALVHVVRHGEVHNPDGVLYARLPGYHLSANGYAMATRLGEFFADAHLDMLRSSPLERAQETMAPIAAHHELPVIMDDRLIEADSLLEGQVFGHTYQALFNPRNWWLFRHPRRPSWGEPYSELARRMLGVLTDAAAAVGAGGRVVLVSHQSPIWTLRCAVEGRPLGNLPFGRQCSLGSVTTFLVDGARVRFLDYAEPVRDLLGADANSFVSKGA